MHAGTLGWGRGERTFERYPFRADNGKGSLQRNPIAYVFAAAMGAGGGSNV